MIDAITFGKDGRMYLIYEGIEGNRDEIRFGENMCAVFKADLNFNLNDLPDAELISKCFAKPVVHVFSGIEECQPGFAVSGTKLSLNALHWRIINFFRGKAHSLLSEIL